MKVRKIPLRQCLGCREMKPKVELVRVVRSPDGVVSLDYIGKKSGRGAYVCHDDPKCLQLAIKKKSLSRAFGVPIPEDILEELTQSANRNQNSPAS